MYIQMVNIHGLIRGDNIEAGRDADTGGQTRYVIDMLKALGEYDEIRGIDLFTRQIRDKRFSADYSEAVEQLSNKCRIIRLPCAGGKYIRKENLWPCLDEFVDRMIAFTLREGRMPDVVHGHYADSGYIASEIASVFGIPLVFTGHSLGHSKLSFLLDNGSDYESAKKKYHIDTRIKQEERVLGEADLVIVSTNYEREHLYRPYTNCNVPAYEVIPPGLNLKRFFPYYEYELPSSNAISEVNKQCRVGMLKDLNRFHTDPDKPLILALCRPEARKNIDLLIDVYGRDLELQALANLAVFAGIRDDITEMEDSEKKILTDMLLLMDTYDLYGKMAVPKHHNPKDDVPELYRIAALKKGVFVSTAYLETFGLTFIEASAVGLPFIGTSKGGPVDIMSSCDSGVLVDIQDTEEIASAIKKLLSDSCEWERLSNNGINEVRRFYSWKNHCDKYIDCLKKLKPRENKNLYLVNKSNITIGERFSSIKYLLISDIDDTLLGDSSAMERVREYLGCRICDIGFGVATGRYLESTKNVLEENKFDFTDVFICSVGTEIYYNNRYVFDKGWASHINLKWYPNRIRAVLKLMPFLELQEKAGSQQKFKISYDLDKEISPDVALPLIHDALTRERLVYKLLFSHSSYIDILPYRASKGKAIRYLSNKWNIALDKIITVGNSGNDRDMLTGNTRSVVVGNYEKELASLRNSNQVYFAEGHYAAGIIEGLKHYNID